MKAKPEPYFAACDQAGIFPRAAAAIVLREARSLKFRIIRMVARNYGGEARVRRYAIKYPDGSCSTIAIFL